MRRKLYIQLKDTFTRNIQKGFPLLTAGMFISKTSEIEEGSLLQLTDRKGNFLAQAYYGKQNKGIGWILSRNPKENIDLHFFREQLTKALKKRADLFADPQTTAFRVFNGEGDGIGGLVIEYFQDYYVVHWYSAGIYTFKAEVIQVLQGVANCKGIYEKKRFNQGGKYVENHDFVWGEPAPEPFIIQENGINYAVYLDDGAMVGIFLDQREVRKTIRKKYAAGKTVLNTFSYTGAFSVAAAMGGAKETTSVDLANRSREKTKEQFLVNQIPLDAQKIIVEDVFQFFKYAGRKQLTYDLVILDPPSFARSKKTHFSAEKDYTNLLREAIAITEKNGVIVASTNCSSFSMQKFKRFVADAFKQSQLGYRIVESFQCPSDFCWSEKYPEGNYLKVLFLQRIDGEEH